MSHSPSTVSLPPSIESSFELLKSLKSLRTTGTLQGTDVISNCTITSSSSPKLVGISEGATVDEVRCVLGVQTARDVKCVIEGKMEEIRRLERELEELG